MVKKKKVDIKDIPKAFKGAKSIILIDLNKKEEES